MPGVSSLNTEEYLWKVQKNIIDKHKYSYDQSCNVLYPLSYYVNTGRASGTFLRRMSLVKPFVMARILVKGYSSGSVDDCIKIIKKKVGEA